MLPGLKHQRVLRRIAEAPPADPVEGAFVTETLDFDGVDRSRCRSRQMRRARARDWTSTSGRLTYLVAGTFEPFFRNNAARWAAALRDAAADVVMIVRIAGHDHAMWPEVFPMMVAWALGA